MMAAILAFIKGLFSKTESDISSLSTQIDNQFGDVKMMHFNIEANSSVTLDLLSGTRTMLFTAGAGDNRSGLYNLTSTSTGTIGLYTLYEASALSESHITGSITLSSSAFMAVLVVIMSGGVSIHAEA